MRAVKSASGEECERKNARVRAVGPQALGVSSGRLRLGVLQGTGTLREVPHLFADFLQEPERTNDRPELPHLAGRRFALVVELERYFADG